MLFSITKVNSKIEIINCNINYNKYAILMYSSNSMDLMRTARQIIWPQVTEA